MSEWVVVWKYVSVSDHKEPISRVSFVMLVVLTVQFVTNTAEYHRIQ